MDREILKTDDLAPYYRVMRLRFEAFALAEEQGEAGSHPLFRNLISTLDEASAAIGESYGCTPAEAQKLREEAKRRLRESALLIKEAAKNDLLPKAENLLLWVGIQRLEEFLDAYIPTQESTEGV